MHRATQNTIDSNTCNTVRRRILVVPPGARAFTKRCSVTFVRYTALPPRSPAHGDG
jgi:hypothetical protein